MLDKTAQKIYDARKCPVCGAPLISPHPEPYLDDPGDKECHHCKTKIKWIQLFVAIEDNDENKN